MRAALVEEVAGRYAGASRFARGYVGGKLRGDPATAAVLALAEARPFGHVADIGCGRGQLGLALLAAGLATRLTGLDRDAAKLAEARAAAVGLPAEFWAADLAAAEVPDCDTALVIDVLYQLPPPAQARLLAELAARARQRVVIRAFDPDQGWRSAIGLAMERAGRAVRRDRNAIAPLPLARLAAPFEAAGFTISIAPCWGGLPLPNMLLVAERI
ncbi:methyltransferase domain-containing protein [Belnapia sp. T6]|uniref:Methyltransferase domain-containing protein n=1 Tax=Belnapia mucosa TaxID=2804532 RepID=A0ABS1V5T2_9PROT|nr:class I SAM-dependent methyltransferase [Belnapia mucosa]MBL6457048.1 methyltransferase domain-containing protein [Belnapia mucosa]